MTRGPQERLSFERVDFAETAAGSGWLRELLYEVVFGTETRAGRIFDGALLLCILASVLVVLFESVVAVRTAAGPALRTLEWCFTILFTVEYVVRLYCVRRPIQYARSFFGWVDLLAVIPTYLSVFLVGSHGLLTIRMLRILRVFRIFKLVHFLRAQRTLQSALRASSRKILIFLCTVLILVVIIGALAHWIEGPENGFTSIPQAMYWAIVTLTTVGYGDIAPQTPAGKILASIVMILGYGIIAVPTGIVTVELSRQEPVQEKVCPRCHLGRHDFDADFCTRCGMRLRDVVDVATTTDDP